MAWEKASKRGFCNIVPRWYCFPASKDRLGVDEKGVVSIFFSEMPDRIRACDIYDLFGCYGEVEEVVIPTKRNGWEKRYRFARFTDTEDARLLAVRLDNIIIDGKKIHANLPRIDRWNKLGRLGVQGAGVNRRPFFKTGSSVHFEGKEGYRKGVLKGFRGGATYAENVVYGKKEEHSQSEFLMSYESNEEDRTRLSKAYVGEVIFPGSSYNIQTYFEMEGMFSIKVTPLGASLCLLEEVEEGFIQDLIGEGNTWWRQWFKEIKPWSYNIVDNDRDIWIRLYGVPSMTWNFDFFVGLGNKIGKFICVDENTSSRSCMDIARIMITVPLLFHLEDFVNVVIDGKEYSLVVREDSFGPLRISSAQKENNRKDLETSSSEFEDENNLASGKSEGEESQPLRASFSSSNKEELLDNRRIMNRKRKLWSKLIYLKSIFLDEEWIIGGYFNSIKNRGERVGKNNYDYNEEWGEFSDFINAAGFIDPPCKEKKFSWFGGDGRCKSRLDRFLVTNSVMDRWGVVGHFIVQRDISDHCPVWLTVDSEDWGPKPFKFNNEWFKDKDFML
ncbi:uncharacterized protein LOC131620126 [Vicia villosa]|uniref:uncharacterized protein LOC131620126 n=1 Tax=Vicia villosa TaxID=3911 RepID=UPI00273B9D20|nr:uncharacterized protein LOC131620126 [Vicia villosa]